MSRTPKVTIAGAGALGLTCALALADAGCAVTVSDPAEAYANASGVAAGMIAPAFEAVLDAAARSHFDILMAARDLWPGLAARAGIGLRRDGAMAVGEAEWLESVAAEFEALGLRPSEISGATARTLAPALSEAWPTALLTREDWRIDAVQALAALREAALGAGVTFRQAAVSGRGDEDLLVVATGAGDAPLAPELAVLSPIKGHILRALAPWAAGVTVRGRGVYVAPGDGVVAVGATMEAGVADAAVDPLKAEPLRAAGARLFQRIAEAPFEIFAGVRAATPDGLPLVGFGSEPGVVLAAGARRNGWLLAPLVAQVVVACATGSDSGPYAHSFGPTRFT